jgi:uncharacterized membrane protein
MRRKKLSLCAKLEIAVDMASSDEKKSYPENHLYAKEFILPPNFAVEKWILEPTFTYTSADNEKIEVTQNMSQLRIKASLNWDL